MYYTVTDVHHAIDLGLQSVDSNRKATILAPDKDTYFNVNMMRFIESRLSNIRNSVQEGLDETLIRKVELQELIFTSSPLQLEIVNDNITSVVLPANALYPISGLVSSLNNCVEVEKETVVKHFATVPFPIDKIGVQGEYYKNFRIQYEYDTGNITTVFNINDYTDFFETLYSTDAQFMIVNAVMNKLPNAYWEKYRDTYTQSSFVITDLTNVISINLSYNGYSKTVLLSDILYDSYKHNNSILTTGKLELIPTHTFDKLIDNFYYNRNRIKSPLGKYNVDTLKIRNDKFYPINIVIDYIKLPIFLNSLTNTMTDLRTPIQKIIDLTVADIMNSLVNTYETAVQKNIMSDNK